MGLEWKPLITFSCVVALVSVQLPPLTYARVCAKSTTENQKFDEPEGVYEWEDFNDFLSNGWKYFKQDTMVPDQQMLYNPVYDERGVMTNFDNNVIHRIHTALESLHVTIIPGTGMGPSDFYAQHTLLNRFLPIEVKTDASLPFDSLYQPQLFASRNPHYMKIIKQIYTFMRMGNIQFGIVTNFDKTFFLRSLDSVIQVSPLVRSAQLLRALASFLSCPGIWGYVNYSAIEIVRHDPGQEDPESPDRNIDDDEYPPPPRGPTTGGSTTSSSNRQTRNQTRVSRGQTGIVMSGYLGGGAGGHVYQAFIGGVPVALKVVRVKDKMKFFQLLNEVTIYNHLSDIQGIYIPELLWHGYLENKDFYAIAITLCLPMNFSTEEEKKNILNALRERSVDHQDIRNANFVRSLDDGKLFIIDFGQSILQKKLGQETEICLNSLPLVG
jgi:hypothetical protein